jgi:hypothetical protein
MTTIKIVASISFSVRTSMRKPCATPCREEKVRWSDSFFSLSEGKGERSVESVETFDQKVGLDYSALTEKTATET